MRKQLERLFKMPEKKDDQKQKSRSAALGERRGRKTRQPEGILNPNGASNQAKRKTEVGKKNKLGNYNQVKHRKTQP